MHADPDDGWLFMYLYIYRPKYVIILVFDDRITKGFSLKTARKVEKPVRSVC
jgi:hypothetical protein